MSDSDTTLGVEQYDQRALFSGRDSVVAPNGHVYTVKRLYEDANGIARVAMRDVPNRHTMYVTVNRLRQLVTDDESDWDHVPNGQL